ncbi:MAG: UvrD-helicase domain-containing protein [Terracidiphilus sp.]|jgi:ATP-dependent exoDNAse (exonuclease V) beta subunit
MPDKQQAPPPDNAQRELALDAARSILVRAPAGSGKTDLLTRRFLLLLGKVDDPGEIVAITFTKAAAAEMRHRILSKLEKAATANGREAPSDPFSMGSLAERALAHSRVLGWDLLNLPAQLRITTIDSFCRELALQEPILSGLSGSLEIHEQPKELYRRAARRTLEQIGRENKQLSGAIETLLLWRDNSWADVEDQIVAMLAKRDQWMHEDFLNRDPDWDALRERLERPFARRVRGQLSAIEQLFDQVSGALEEAHELARFACEQSGGVLHSDLAELADFPAAPFSTTGQLEEAHRAYRCLTDLLLTGEGSIRKQLNIAQGFPKEHKSRKERLLALLARLSSVPDFALTLYAVRDLPSPRYADEDWEIVRACFTVLRHAAGQLRVVFAETAKADFIEIAQIAQKALKGEDNLPSDTAQAFADRIHHLLVDEFQDTSRRQHKLLAHLIAAWSGREGRTCFVVGDPMQSIYFFRDADTELFLRAERLGLEIPGDLPLLLDPLQLFANFRSAPSLVDRLNHAFTPIFAEDDGSGIEFTPAQSARDGDARPGPQPVEDSPRFLQFHPTFMPVSRGGSRGISSDERDLVKKQREATLEQQTQEIVALIRSHLERMENARAAGEKYRIAVLGRARNALTPVAQALREAVIPFRAIELEPLLDRPEIIDALALARALYNPEDRVAWLGVLRAPWCALSLADLHTLTSADDEELKSWPILDLLAERASLLSEEGCIAAARVRDAAAFAARVQSTLPTASLGTRLEQVWLRLGGAQCADAAARINLDLLWRCLDELPEGEPDLLGTALDAALADLKALPDPAASVDCGVQLMTMHGAKGLEFEVVIVPELQAGSGSSKTEMLAWLERGLPPETATAPGEITDFLVAPFPPKGADRSSTKAWVDRVRRKRERQELRRILYVAATRARDELHLFARPEFRSAADGSLTLVEPRESLLETAWPALRSEIQSQFEGWRDAARINESHTIDSLAASAENLLAMPAVPEVSQLKPTRMRRLPASFQPVSGEFSSAADEPLIGAGRLYERHEGGLLSRALGIAVHKLFQYFAQFRITEKSEVAQASLARIEPSITADLRALGIDASEAKRIAAHALGIVLRASNDPQAEWILAPHANAASEARWTGVASGSLRTVQVDRVFRAGPTPLTAAGDTWWIIDYKTADYQTAHEDGLDPQVALPELRRIFRPQIEAYAEVLRNLHGAAADLQGGLYYPRMRLLDWWKL